MEDPISTVSIDLRIPSEKLRGQAAIIMKSYQPIVEDVLREVQYDLHCNEDFKNELKLAVKAKVKELIKEEVVNMAQRQAKAAMDEKFDELFKTIVQ